jgi:hypothetical protein
MGIPTLISTATASNAASVSITSGIDSTYDEYMFVFTDINPATDDAHFTCQFNESGGADFNETITSTVFRGYHAEDDSAANLAYDTGADQAQGTAYQHICGNVGNGADESCAGIMHLFSPSSTTFAKHFYARLNKYHAGSNTMDVFTAGYINTTAAIDEVDFKFSSGNMDGVIQLYGIA